MEFLKKNISGNNGTLINHMDLPQHNVNIESPNTNTMCPR